MGRKIIDKIDEAYARGGVTVSFEFFPAKTEAGVDNLLRRIEHMGHSLQPTFVTLTWRSAFKDEAMWLKLGTHVQRMLGLDVLLHLTCHLPIDDLRRILRSARSAGIRNILALRGDPPIGEDRWKPKPGCFRNAVELVRLIREEHGDYFCVAVAGYPEVHIESWNHPVLPPSKQCRALDIARLREKVEAGADLIITQFFFDADIFLDFVQRCRDAGIRVPIVAGYLPIQNYRSFVKFTAWCKTSVPKKVEEDLEAIKDDDERVKAYGIKLAADTLGRLLASGVQSLHFYTMNMEQAVTAVLTQLTLAPKAHQRELPWAGAAARPRAKDEVRPIFWANRQMSYLSRTAEWTEFPNGRWGASSNPAYGDLTDYYLASKRPMVDRLKFWGRPASEEDVAAVFVKYVEGTIPQLPWCDAALAEESSVMVESLRWINRHGFLTINSQPKVNGAPSTDPKVGWGGPGGFVFQKAYIEFFTSGANLRRLQAALGEYPSLAMHAIDRAGHEVSNYDVAAGSVTAVTWGVFPGREVIQPTVVDPASFKVWRGEAFELWLSQWASVYSEPGDETSRRVIEGIVESYFLVNLVDNDYTSEGSDIFALFKRVIAEQLSRGALLARVEELEGTNAALRRQTDALSTRLRSTTEELRKTQAANHALRAETSRLQERVRDMETQRLLGQGM